MVQGRGGLTGADVSARVDIERFASALRALLSSEVRRGVPHPKQCIAVHPTLLSPDMIAYGVGPNTLGLLKFYWDKQRCVAKTGKYHGETFAHTVVQRRVVLFPQLSLMLLWMQW